MSETNRMVNELKLAGLFDKDSDYEGMVGKAVKELLETFQKQGHSGMSAPHVAKIFSRLIQGDTLTPLTGEDSEWMEVGEDLLQNVRCSSVFKNTKTGEANNIDAIVWTGEGRGDTFTGTVDDIRSSQNLKFPFMPKTFYIDVIGKEVEKHNWEYHIKDPKQLDKVFKYYIKK